MPASTDSLATRENNIGESGGGGNERMVQADLQAEGTSSYLQRSRKEKYLNAIQVGSFHATIAAPQPISNRRGLTPSGRGGFWRGLGRR